MNALTAILFRCWVVIVDETGPIGHSYPLSDSVWPTLSPEKLLEVVKAAHPGLPIVSAKWAERPRDYTISDPVLLVSIPGTHEVKVAPKRVRKQKQRVEEDWDAGGVGGTYKDRIWDAVREGRAVTVVPAPVAVAVEPGPKCPCGIGHTFASYRALPMLAAAERTEGFTVILDESRTCACGEALHFTTKRLLGWK